MDINENNVLQLMNEEEKRKLKAINETMHHSLEELFKNNYTAFVKFVLIQNKLDSMIQSMTIMFGTELSHKILEIYMNTDKLIADLGKEMKKRHGL